VVWGHPHDAPPLTAVVFALVVQTMRHLNAMRFQGRKIGALVVRVIVVILFSVTLDRAQEHKCDVNEERCARAAALPAR
jgi:hypothetical protein